MILKVCEEHRDTINGMIAMKAQNINIKRNAEDYLKRMTPIAVALDKVQSDSCKLSDAVGVWKALKRDMDSLMPSVVTHKVQNRYKQALSAPHYLANLMDPRYRGITLSKDEVDAGLNYAAWIIHHVSLL
ncbi:hypothetical protein LOD99_8928 [Oopsacas minuta]|uniref:Uncharacterized protein n=1 Tax=Oopsacas minuta TaxID=111878 RepID=A0AAV7JEG9_9METZ|nr:hypothetical protein LOD99_8928 [Oopsacas minuta]